MNGFSLVCENFAADEQNLSTISDLVINRYVSIASAVSSPR